MNCIHGIDIGMWCSICAKGGPFPCGTYFVHDGMIARGVDSSYVNPNATGTYAEEIAKIRHSIDALCGSVDKLNEATSVLLKPDKFGYKTTDERDNVIVVDEHVNGSWTRIHLGPISDEEIRKAFEAGDFCMRGIDVPPPFRRAIEHFAKSRGLL